MPIQEWLTNLCMPSVEYISDNRERNLVALRTKTQLIFYSALVTALIYQFLQGNITLFPQRTIVISCLLSSLLVCRRSYLQIYYIILTLFITFMPMMITRSGEAMLPLGMAFFGTIFLYLVTDSWYYYSFAAIMYLYNYNVFLKQQLEATIIHLGPKEFSSQIIQVFSIQLLISIGFLVILHQGMKKVNHDLWKSKVEAENSLSHYKTFLFSFSHEIRNPINILLGNLELALQERLPASALEVIQTAKISAELLLQLINNVLDVGKAEVGKLEIVPTPTRIHELLVRMWNLASDLIKKKKLFGYLKISRILPSTLEIDPDRLNQVLLNLLGNAIKFTKQGAINLTIEWLTNHEQVSDACFEPLPFDQDEEGIFDKDEIFSTLGYYNGSATQHEPFYVFTHLQKRTSTKELKQTTFGQQRGVLKIIVKDQGCGMSKEAMKGLFRKFYQCSNEASDRKRGTGLGLYITKDICEKMGGEIRVYSQENRGSVFIACIPSMKLKDKY